MKSTHAVALNQSVPRAIYVVHLLQKAEVAAFGVGKGSHLSAGMCARLGMEDIEILAAKAALATRQC